MAAMYRVIRKPLRDFRILRYSSRDGHAKGEHVNRGRGTPNFCPTLQVLDMSTLGDAADINPVHWHAPLRRDHPGYCTAEVGNPKGTYELPCIITLVYEEDEIVYQCMELLGWKINSAVFWEE